MDVWFCRVDGQIFGPLKSAEVREMSAQGLIRPDTETRNGAGGQWQPLGEIQGLVSPVDASGVIEVPDDGEPKPVQKPRYKALRSISRNIRALGNLMLLVYLLGIATYCIIVMRNASTTGAGPAAILAVVVAIISLPLVLLVRLILLAISELILLAVSVEDASWESVRQLQAIREQGAGRIS